LPIAAFAFAWRITLGMFDLQGSNDASMLLNLPIWWGYADDSFILPARLCGAVYRLGRFHGSPGMTGLETGAAAGVLMLFLMALRVHIAWP
jgi:hypothetical protein